VTHGERRLSACVRDNRGSSVTAVRASTKPTNAKAMIAQPANQLPSLMYFEGRASSEIGRVAIGIFVWSSELPSLRFGMASGTGAVEAAFRGSGWESHSRARSSMICNLRGEGKPGMPAESVLGRDNITTGSLPILQHFATHAWLHCLLGMRSSVTSSRPRHKRHRS
jgi:hypothetical protein